MTIAPDIAAIAFLLAFLAGPTDAGVVVREVEAAAAPSPGACAPVMERIAAVPELMRGLLSVNDTATRDAVHTVVSSRLPASADTVFTP